MSLLLIVTFLLIALVVATKVWTKIILVTIFAVLIVATLKSNVPRP